LEVPLAKLGNSFVESKDPSVLGSPLLGSQKAKEQHTVQQESLHHADSP